MDNVDIKGAIGKSTEIAFAFDTTSSMRPAIDNVRKNIEKACEELFEDIPNLKIGFICFGDYCDGDNCYKILDLTDDKSKIFNFIRSAPNTFGGDEAECYELALNLVSKLNWSEGDGKVLVLIGDTYPHDIDYPQNTDKLDWKKELEILKNKGINVYPLQCLYHESKNQSNSFWSYIGEFFNTPLLKLNDLENSTFAFTGMTYAAAGPSAFTSYEKKLTNITPVYAAMNAVFKKESIKYKEKS